MWWILAPRVRSIGQVPIVKTLFLLRGCRFNSLDILEGLGSMVETTWSDSLRWICLVQIFHGCNGHRSPRSVNHIEKNNSWCGVWDCTSPLHSWWPWTYYIESFLHFPYPTISIIHHWHMLWLVTLHIPLTWHTL